MLCSGLTAIMIILHGILFTHSSPAKDVSQKAGATASSSYLAIRHIREKCNNYVTDIRMNKRLKNWHRLIQKLESVVLKLQNVIDRYESKKLKSLYHGVAHCGRDKCGKFSDLDILPNKTVQRFYCWKFEKPNDLKKWTSRHLSYFRNGVRNIDSSFQELIKLENSSYFSSNGSRLQILNVLHNDLKTLNLEIREMLHVTSNKRLNLQRRNKTMVLPISETELLISEWRIIQQSKEFLQKRRKEIDKMYRCWEKTFCKTIKQKKRNEKPRERLSRSQKKARKTFQPNL